VGIPKLLTNIDWRRTVLSDLLLLSSYNTNRIYTRRFVLWELYN